MGLGPFVNYRPPSSYGPAMPPMMVTKESALVELDVEPTYWNGARRVACFRAHWEDEDCFFLAATEHLPLPATVKTLAEHAAMILTVGSRKVLKNRYFDEDGKSLLAAFETHMDVEFVHSL